MLGDPSESLQPHAFSCAIVSPTLFQLARVAFIHGGTADKDGVGEPTPVKGYLLYFIHVHVFAVIKF